VAQVLTYVRQSWGNAARPVTTDDVTRLKSKLK
jgi:mono/diheme cytochrome c family protein